MVAQPTVPKAKGKDGKKEAGKETKQVSDEDLKLQEELELLVDQLEGTDEEKVKEALMSIAGQLQTATSSMTSVPKPLKFLRPMFSRMVDRYEKLADGPVKVSFADALSVLATTASAGELKEGRTMLRFRLEGSGAASLSSWGHEYMRNLSSEIATEYQERLKEEKPTDDLLLLVEAIVAYYMDHNAECEAVDLLAEVESVEKIVKYVDKNSSNRVVLYLLSLGNYSASWDDFSRVMKVGYEIMMKQGQFCDALRVAMKVNSQELIAEVLHSCTDALTKRQLALMCSRQRVQIIFTRDNTKPATTTRRKGGGGPGHQQPEEATAAAVGGGAGALKTEETKDHPVKEQQEQQDVEMKPQAEEKTTTKTEKNNTATTTTTTTTTTISSSSTTNASANNNTASGDTNDYVEELVELTDLEVDTLCVELNRLMTGEALTQHFGLLAKELDVMEPKLPEDVYKMHLEERRGMGGVALDSARQNLASTLVNAFVNAGFCNDKLMTVEKSNWIFKNKEHGMTSASASVGVLLMWNVEKGLEHIDKFQWSEDSHIKMGGLMAFGLMSAGIKNDCDPAFGLLSHYLEANSGPERLGAALGLGFAYGGTRREDILELMIPVIIDCSFTVECSAMAALSVGLIFVGSCNPEAAEAILQTLLERQTTKGALDRAIARFFGVGLALLFLGTRDSCESTLCALEAVTHPLGGYSSVTVEGFAFAGSGDVLKIQRMMQLCVEKREAKEGEDEDAVQMNQAVAVLNLPIIAMSEEIGSEMTLRCLDHLLQYAELPQRRAIPLALAVHSVSNPRPAVVDTLSKLSHDADADVALHAIMSLGLVGAGTNNSRIAGLLRQLAAFYAKDSNAMFVVRISQGLLYMGKGLLSINPIHSDRFLVNPVGLGSLLTVLHAGLHFKSTILGRQHYLLYHLIPAMYPRMLITVDQDLNHLQVAVRVGQAVDTIGQAGRPKTITGFQTHNTPVLLSFTDRAELATEQYIPVSSVMEGVVILKRNPHFNPDAATEQTPT
eukprot:GHVS01069754.1.p1 GENE.GHVS01069754.1~~GHVS01069754.1.p1  ORF type:complete len:1011 (+),score=212.58 GHVS01069754.1:139-3171(+)